MKYKLDCNISNFYGNTRALSEEELESLINGNTSSGDLFLLSGEEAIIVCDLNDRYNINSFKYYYSGDGTISMSVSECQDVWNTVSYTTISGAVVSLLEGYSPRWLRVAHEVTTGSGNIYEIEVYNNDSNILFGHYGNNLKYGMDASGLTPSQISIYNPTQYARDINVFVGDGVNGADSLLSVGTTSSGVFYAKYEHGLNLPGDFSWDNGIHINTIDNSNYLTLSGTSTSGTYYSPVFYTAAYPDSRVFWEYSLEDGGYVDYKSTLDGSPCVGIRKHNHAPTGSWVNGTMPDEEDQLWSVSSGTLEFIPVTNNSILDVRNNYYLQFILSISGTHPNPPYITRLGVEGPLVVEGIQPGGFKDIYVSSVSGTVGDKTANLMCWYRE